MSKVWRRLQRVGKKASKFRLTTFNHVLTLTCNTKWQPDKICLTWTHRGRKYQSKFSTWEPGLTNVYEGVVEWEKSSDQIEFDVTLYKGINDNKYEEKEWMLMVESEDNKGKRRLLATGKINAENYVSIDPFHQKEIKDFNLKPQSTKIKNCSISFLIACQFIKDGKATDEDMISIASFMSSASTNNPYLNSNFIFDQKFDDDEDEYENNNNNTNEYNKNTLKSNKQLNKDNIHTNNFNEIYQNELNIANELDEDMDYYFKLENQELNSNFNNIAFNFNNTFSSQNTTIKQNTSPIIKSSNTTLNSTINSSTMSTSTLVKIPSTKILPNQTSNSKIKSSSSNSNLAQTKILDNTNPFLEKEETNINEINSSNPFGEETDKADDSKNNPFIDNNPNNNVVDDNNPFLDNKNLNSNFSIELDRNSNVESIRKKNESINLDESTNTSKDLLDWCKDIIKKSHESSDLFKNLLINDFSTSWNNGLAFCALIHHFRPNLIDLKKLSESDPKSNLKQAFSASDKESIVRVVDYSDIINKKTLDQLSIMTYLYQIRDRYDPQLSSNIQTQMTKSKTLPAFSIQIDQLNKENNKNESHKSNDKSKEILNKKEVHIPSVNHSKPISKNSYFNPFDSDDDGIMIQESKKNSSNNKMSNGIIEIKSNGQIIDSDGLFKINKEVLKKNKQTDNQKNLNQDLNPTLKGVESSEELILKAKNLIEKNKSPIEQDMKKSKKEELKHKAKQIIAESRKTNRRKSSSGSNSSNSTKDKNENKNLDNSLNPFEQIEDVTIGVEYINQEIINLKNKQKELDEKGNYIEKQLRNIMKKTSSDIKSSNEDKKLEDKLLKDWFLLINQKNALLHHQQELELLQNEKNLEKRSEILSQQLRNLMEMDESMKTDEQKKSETILLNELITLVNKRNELIIQIDEENKLLNEGEYLDEFIQNKSSFQDKEKQCSIQ